MQLHNSWILHLCIVNGNNAAIKNLNTFVNAMAVKNQKMTRSLPSPRTLKAL
jgi:hypothetical protein